MPANTEGLQRRSSGGIEAWRERISSVFMRFEMEAPQRRSFPGAVGQRDLGPLRLYDFSAPAHRIRRRPDPARAGDARRVLAVLQEKGNCRYADANGTLTLAPGDVVFLHSGQPFQMSFPDQMRLRVVSMPMAALSRSVIAAGALPTVVARADAGATAIGRALVNSAYATSHRLSAAEQARAARALVDVLDLVGAAALHDAGVLARSARDAQLDRILAYMRDHLEEPGLDGRALARALEISPRYVRELLHSQGTSFGRLRLEQRLERCRDDLLDPFRRHRSVSDIAYAWGFNSPAHFSRVFRDRYGVPPARFRRRSGPPDAAG